MTSSPSTFGPATINPMSQAFSWTVVTIAVLTFSSRCMSISGCFFRKDSRSVGRNWVIVDRFAAMRTWSVSACVAPRRPSEKIIGRMP